MSQHDNGQEHGHAHDVTVQVQTVKGTRTYTLPQQTKVSDLIARAVADLGLPAGDTYSLERPAHGGETLAPERTLVSYHLDANEKLVLSAITGGA